MSADLRVIINDRPLRQTLTGVGHYIRELMLHLPGAAPQVHADPFYFQYLSRRDWRSANDGQQRGTQPPVRAFELIDAAHRHAPGCDTGGIVREQSERDRSARRAARAGGLAGSRKPWWMRNLLQGAYGVAFRTITRRYDLYHEPNHIPMKSALPTVTTVHDLSVLAHPEWHPADRVKWYEREFAAGVRQTRRFIAASQYTKQEMVRRLAISPDIIDVTYQAPRSAFRPASAEHSAAYLDERKLPRNFFLYVGTLEPRKNLPGLLRAYSKLPGDLRKRIPLLLVGAWGWKQEHLREHLADADIAADVYMMGYLPDDELALLYSACAALVWPTFYEGFGMPPLEAMACGAPVIVSRETSLPEVVGDAGVLLDPHAERPWTDAMRQAAEDEAWRAAARSRSLARAAEFSWRRCAEQTVRCYEAALR